MTDESSITLHSIKDKNGVFHTKFDAHNVSRTNILIVLIDNMKMVLES